MPLAKVEKRRGTGLGGAAGEGMDSVLALLERQTSRGRSEKVGLMLIHVQVCAYMCILMCTYMYTHCMAVKGKQVREQFLRSAQSEL